MRFFKTFENVLGVNGEDSILMAVFNRKYGLLIGFWLQPIKCLPFQHYIKETWTIPLIPHESGQFFSNSAQDSKRNWVRGANVFRCDSIKFLRTVPKGFRQRTRI